MTSPRNLTATALPEHLEPGDLLINLTDQELACSVPFVADTDGEFHVSTGFLAPPLCQGASTAAQSCDQLQAVCVTAQRLVVVSNEATCPLVEELAAAGRPVAWIQLATDCDADSFMDEADSEAVAERLRQLGYI